MADLDAIDPEWVRSNFEPRLAWNHPEALTLWRSFAYDRIGSARLFNALKPAMLTAFERQELSDHEFEGLMSKLLTVAIWHQRGEAPEYNLTNAEMRHALSVGPSAVRRHVSWSLWSMMREAGNGEEHVKLTRWRTVVGPLFKKIWPLDACLRSGDTTQNLVMMALECGEAFPEAVDAILNVIAPYQFYQVAHSLRLDDSHSAMVSQYPQAFLKLTDALIDPEIFPAPNDLGTLLDECIVANSVVERDPSYIRLRALQRQRSA
jgi:hypothetical protein